jgi:hypothetical protein
MPKIKPFIARTPEALAEALGLSAADARKWQDSHLEALHRRMDESLGSLDRGEGADGETFMAGLLKDLGSQEHGRRIASKRKPR